jgi:hypothetical protein
MQTVSGDNDPGKLEASGEGVSLPGLTGHGAKFISKVPARSLNIRLS